MVCLLLTIAAGSIFAFLSGWTAYILAFVLLVVAHLTPHIAFANGSIFPYLAPVWAAWLSVFPAAAWQYFVVRRQLRKSESDKARYQQAIHFVTHEMRSPLTAIQGSSELMGRYNLNDAKRKQMADMINAESKRLARMIQTFLDIERLTDGQMEIRSEVFDAAGVIGPCLERARPLAERKQIEFRVEEMEPSTLTRRSRVDGIRRLQSAHERREVFAGRDDRDRIRAPRSQSASHYPCSDQGIGMDEKELRNIFRSSIGPRKRKRPARREQESGLSIVEQIVASSRRPHGGDQHARERVRVLRWYYLPPPPLSWYRTERNRALIRGVIRLSRLLVVEDDSSVRNTVVTFLELEGYEVDAVSSTREACSACSRIRTRSCCPISIWTNAPGSTSCRRRRAPIPIAR